MLPRWSLFAPCRLFRRRPVVTRRSVLAWCTLLSLRTLLPLILLILRRPPLMRFRLRHAHHGLIVSDVGRCVGVVIVFDAGDRLPGHLLSQLHERHNAGFPDGRAQRHRFAEDVK